MKREKVFRKIQEISVNIANTSINSVRRKNIEKTSIRIFDEGQIGVAGKIGSVNEDKLEKKAITALKYGLKYPYDLSKDKKEEWLNQDKILSTKEFLELSEALLAYLREKQNKFNFSNKIFLTGVERKMNNSEGLNLKFIDNFVNLQFAFKEKSSSNIIDGGFGYAGREFDLEKVKRYADKICNAYLNKVELPTEKKMPIVFLESDRLLFKKFKNELHGMNFGTGGSIFSKNKNEKLFNDDFTLYQNDNPQDTFSPFFDAEGTVNDNYIYELISAGKLITPYTDKKNSVMFDLKLTGSAGASYDSIPMITQPNLAVRKSEKTLKELLNGRKAIFVMIASGGDFTSEGDFGTPVQLSYLIENGKIIGRLPQLQISSNLYKIFGEDYIGVSKDKFFESGVNHYIATEMNVKKMD